jgi:hypothetical protein
MAAALQKLNASALRYNIALHSGVGIVRIAAIRNMCYAQQLNRPRSRRA